MRFFFLLGAALVIGVAAPLANASINFPISGSTYPVEYIATSGTGPFTNSAMLVLDFGPHIYQFGYEWNGSRTSAQMIDDIAAAGGVDVTASNIGTPGEFTTGITYAGAGQLYAGTNPFGDYPDNWYLYYVGREPSTWDFGQVGEGENTLANGDWNLWAWETDADGTNDPGPVPEPASLGILMLGAGMLICLRMPKLSCKAVKID